MTQTRYEIVSTIGVGATSRVDKAHDTLIDRTVALKTFGHGFGSEELQNQFLREAQILGRLSHPNIVSIYDLGTNEDGSAYLVMEFVPGKTLESVMAAQGALPLPRIGVWAGDLANALNRAHRGGIVHGDVKPANIFVTDEGHIKLGDFGIARYATQLSGTGKLVGTPAYLSPEQIKGETQDHRSDIFSLGIVLYQLATGVRPFDGSSVTAVCAQIVATDPAPPSRHNPALPKEFDRIVMRCLAKDPSARYASGESLAASLYPFARSKPAAPPNRFDFSWFKRPLRSQDAWIAVAAVSTALLLLPAAYHWRNTRAARKMAAQTASYQPALASGAIRAVPEKQSDMTDVSAAIGGDSANLEKGTVPDRAVTIAGGLSSVATSHELPANRKPRKSSAEKSRPATNHASTPDAAASVRNASLEAAASAKPAPPTAATNVPAEPQVPLSVEITSALEGETLAVYADQHLLATSSLSITSSGETLHLERTLSSGPHEFRIVLYKSDQSLHLEREGLAELHPDSTNVLSIHVVRRAKMLVKHDAALEILWPGAPLPKTGKSDSVTFAAESGQTNQ